MNYTMIFFHKLMNSKGYYDGVHYKQLCYYHDELNVEFPEDDMDMRRVGEAAMRKAIKIAEEKLHILCPLEMDVKWGRDWYAVH
jgi:DNA polymerase I-like protein with 3'-5' exonuclease and polymerase domains